MSEQSGPTSRRPSSATGRGIGSGRGRGRGRAVGSNSMMMTPQQLRQRRVQIIKDKVQDEQEEQKWIEASRKGLQTGQQYMIKVYRVIVAAIIVTLLALLNHLRPAFLFKDKRRRLPPAPPPLQMATLYPPNVILERDLPRFFRTYSIATRKNIHARRAVLNVIESRMALNYGTGNLKINLKAWDRTMIRPLMMEKNLCGGTAFELAYQSASIERQNDLIMWCLLTTRIAEGVFQGSVQMLTNAFHLYKKRGMVVIPTSSSGDGDESHRRRLSRNFYLHPRILEEEEDEDVNGPAQLPSEILTWLLEHPESSLSNPSLALEEQIYNLVMSSSSSSELLQQQEQDQQDPNEGGDRYMFLDEICQESSLPPPDRAIARMSCDNENDEDTSIAEAKESRRSLSENNNNNNSCCYIVVRPTEGGRIRIPTNKRAQQLEEKRRSLRKSS